MSYATQDDLVTRYGEDLLLRLTDTGEVQATEIDAAAVAKALADADAVIDGYVAVRYALPMAAVPPLIADLALSIAIYKLCVYEPDDKLVRDHNDALRQLRQISDGTIKLEIAGAEAAGTGGTGARVTDRDRPMTEDNLKGFI